MAVPPGAAPPPDQAESAGQLAASIEEAAGCLAALWNHDAADLPTSSAQMHVLLVVERHRDLNLSGLAAQINALVSSASRLCDRLEAAGLLHRAPGSSGRAVALRLSHDGAALLDRLRRQRRDDLSGVLARMPPGARAALATGLSQFRAAADRRGPVQFGS
ncbi:MAG TPA: MarR family transcriptional regulator [Streptosporangiaceae bacterium]|jgi:DNA-binding MarR family transcriptional regulator